LQVKEIIISEKTPCLLEPRKITVSAQTDKPLNEVLPILYLSIPQSNYSKAFGSVTFLRSGKLVSIYSSGKINLGCVVREEIAKDLLEDLKKLINRAFEYFEIHGQPDSKLIEIRGKVSPLTIYNLLPKTNCKECGEQGCFAFATKLCNGEKTLQDCAPLNTLKYAENKSQIENMLQPIKLE
jgi:ArsR family metal-binding transcriptional regulator